MKIRNSDMKSARFARWASARKRLAFITTHLKNGKTVQVYTYTKCWNYTAQHIGMFKATPSGLFVQRGKHWDCLDGAGIRAVQTVP